MRFSPTKILQGLLCSTPVLVLALAACGGGGGSSDGTLGSAYTLAGNVSGLTSNGLILRNNGGDDLTVAANAASFVFATKVLSTSNYNVTVLTQPSAPPQRCDVANASGSMPAYDLPASGVPAITVTCNPAFTIGGTISGLTSNGLVLQNNLGDNLLAASGVPGFTFSTPLTTGQGYHITILTQPNSQTCSFNSPPASGVVASSDINEAMTCNTTPPSPPSDRFVYAVNYGSNDLWAYLSSSGALSTIPLLPYSLEANPSAIAVDPAGKYLYQTNQGGNDIRVYSIDNSTGALTLADADSSIAFHQDSIATGPGPIKIRIHPSGRLAYVLNQTNNSVSGYSIDPITGALSAIDLNGIAIGNTIPTRSIPSSIAIHPAGGYAYVTNAGVPGILIYSIDEVTGLLTALPDADSSTTGFQDTIDTGGTPYSIAIDPSGSYAYVANGAGGGAHSVSSNGDVWVYNIDSNGLLSYSTSWAAGTGPRAVAIDPSGKFAYVVNGGSGDISAYTITSGTGALVQINCGGGIACNTAGSPISYPQNYLAHNSPISISIDRSGQYVYVANRDSFDISTYSINPSTGELTPVGTYSSGTTPQAITTAP